MEAEEHAYQLREEQGVRRSSGWFRRRHRSPWWSKTSAVTPRIAAKQRIGLSC